MTHDEPIKPGYKRTEVGVIPEDWKVVSIHEIADVKTGPFGSALHERDYVEDGTPIITVEHLGERGVLHSNLPMVSDDDKKRLRVYELEENDIVFSRVGAIDRNSLIRASEAGWLFSGRLLRVRPDRRVFAPYLSYHFHTEAFKERVRSVAVGQTMASLNTQILNGIDVILPPLTEQIAIAEVLSDVDALLEALDRLIAKKRDIKLGAMQALLTGRIRLSGFLRKSGYKHTEVGIIPEDWDLCTFGKLVNIRNNKVNPALVDPSTPCVELENIGQGTGHLIGYSLAEQSTSTKYRFIKKDVLYGRLRAYLRKFWLAEFDGICTTEIWPLKPVDDQIRNEFLLQVVQTDRFNEAASVAYGTHMPRADWGVISNLSIPLPDPAEQTAIAEVLSDMDAEIEALEKRRAKLRAIKQGMMQELLTGRTRLIQPQKQAQEVNA